MFDEEDWLMEASIPKSAWREDSNQAGDDYRHCQSRKMK